MTAPYYTAIQSRKEDIRNTDYPDVDRPDACRLFHPAATPPALNNDAIVSSEVNGVTQHRAPR